MKINNYLPIFLFLSCLTISFFSQAQSNCPELEMLKTLGGKNDDMGLDIVSDKQGNSYFIGSYMDTVSFGDTTYISKGYSDPFIIKKDSEGNLVWMRTIIGNSVKDLSGIAIDPDDNIYVTGMFRGKLFIGNDTLSSAGYLDVYIVKINTNGEFLWAKQGGGSGSDRPRGISADNQGNCYVIGDFEENIIFGSTTIINNGNLDIFIAKLNTDGDFVWAKGAGGSSLDYGIAIAADAQGNCYITGTDGGESKFGNITLPYFAHKDIFIAKLNASGDFIWAKRVNGEGYFDQGNSIQVDAQNNIYVTGQYSLKANFGDISLTNSGYTGYDDAFITKLDANGNFIWAKSIGGEDDDNGRKIVVDFMGNSYITGSYSSTALFGSDTLESNGEEDAFITKLDANGNFLWARNIVGGPGKDVGLSLTLGLAGDIIVTGYFTDTASVGADTLKGNGRADVFFAGFCNDSDFSSSINKPLSPLSSVNIYPNPVSGVLTLETMQQTTGTFTIIDMKGAVVYQGTLVSGKSTIDLAMLTNGLYLLKSYSSKEIICRKFLKN